MSRAEAEKFSDAPEEKSSRSQFRRGPIRAMERPLVAAAAAADKARAARRGREEDLIDGPDQIMRPGTAGPYMSRCANPLWIAPHRDGWPLRGCA